MSGRHTCIVPYDQFADELIDLACTRLALPRRGSERLLQGTREVPTENPVQDWRGIARLGEITELQLIV
eukprot:28160-Amphidinium_carterae.1